MIKKVKYEDKVIEEAMEVQLDDYFHYVGCISCFNTSEICV